MLHLLQLFSNGVLLARELLQALALILSQSLALHVIDHVLNLLVHLLLLLAHLLHFFHHLLHRHPPASAARAGLGVLELVHEIG